MGLVGTEYYSAEYSELGLSVVVHTGRDENGTDLAKISLPRQRRNRNRFGVPCRTTWAVTAKLQ